MIQLLPLLTFVPGIIFGASFKSLNPELIKRPTYFVVGSAFAHVLAFILGLIAVMSTTFGQESLTSSVFTMFFAGFIGGLTLSLVFRNASKLKISVIKHSLYGGFLAAGPYTLSIFILKNAAGEFATPAALLLSFYIFWQAIFGLCLSKSAHILINKMNSQSITHPE